MKFYGQAEVGMKEGMHYSDLCSLSLESLIDKCFKFQYVPITVHLWDGVSSLYGLI